MSVVGTLQGVPLVFMVCETGNRNHKLSHVSITGDQPRVALGTLCQSDNHWASRLSSRIRCVVAWYKYNRQSIKVSLLISVKELYLFTLSFDIQMYVCEKTLCCYYGIPTNTVQLLRAQTPFSHAVYHVSSDPCCLFFPYSHVPTVVICVIGSNLCQLQPGGRDCFPMWLWW